MKKILLVISVLSLSACDIKTYITEWDCGSEENRRLMSESFNTCLKDGGSTATTCGNVTKKLYCNEVIKEIKHNEKY